MTCILSIGLTRAEVLGKGKLGTEASGPSPSDGSAVVHDGCWPTETEPEHKKRTTHVLILRTKKVGEIARKNLARSLPEVLYS